MVQCISFLFSTFSCRYAHSSHHKPSAALQVNTQIYMAQFAASAQSELPSPQQEEPEDIGARSGILVKSSTQEVRIMGMGAKVTEGLLP